MRVGCNLCDLAHNTRGLVALRRLKSADEGQLCDQARYWTWVSLTFVIGLITMALSGTRLQSSAFKMVNDNESNH